MIEDKEKQKLFKKFQKAIGGNLYIHADQELNEELEFAFEWFWKVSSKDREDAWKYRDLNK